MSDELIEQFVLEGRELAQRATEDLLALERTPGDAARLAGAFRAVHTLKGAAGLFDFAPMSEALHAAEDLLGALRGGRLAVDPAVIDAVLGCVEATEAWIEAVAANGRLPERAAAQAAALIHTLRAPLGDADAAEPPAPAASRTPAWLTTLLAEQTGPASAAGLTGVRYRPTRDCFFRGDDPLALAAAIPELRALRLSGAEAQDADRFDPYACTLVIEALSAAPAARLREVFRLVPDQVEIEAAPVSAPAPVAAPVSAPASATGRALRVDAARIDALAAIAGELAVARHRLAHAAASAARAAPNKPARWPKAWPNSTG